MKCQHPDCPNEATWREVNHYTQQGKDYGPFFYYLCDEHKQKSEADKTPGHRKEFNKLSGKVGEATKPDRGEQKTFSTEALDKKAFDYLIALTAEKAGMRIEAVREWVDKFNVKEADLYKINQDLHSNFLEASYDLMIAVVNDKPYGHVSHVVATGPREALANLAGGEPVESVVGSLLAEDVSGALRQVPPGNEEPGTFYIKRTSDVAAQVIITRSDGTQHVDYPIKYPHSGKIAYDFPERVPQEVKNAVEEFFSKRKHEAKAVGEKLDKLDRPADESKMRAIERAIKGDIEGAAKLLMEQETGGNGEKGGSASDLERELNQFTGTEHYYAYGRIKLTDGVKYLADKAEAYWLCDIVASYQMRQRVARESFQLWELKVLPKSEAVVTMRPDTGRPAIVTQRIPYTDFPLAGIKLYLIDGILLLPSEY